MRCKRSSLQRQVTILKFAVLKQDYQHTRDTEPAPPCALSLTSALTSAPSSMKRVAASTSPNLAASCRLAICRQKVCTRQHEDQLLSRCSGVKIWA